MLILRDAQQAEKQEKESPESLEDVKKRKKKKRCEDVKVFPQLSGTFHPHVQS